MGDRESSYVLAYTIYCKQTIFSTFLFFLQIPSSGATVCTSFCTLYPEIYPEILSEKVKISFNPSFVLYNKAVSVWKPEETLPLGRPRRRWEDNIKMDL